MKALLITFALYVLAVTQAPAAEYFIAPGGNNANPGTREEPFLTLERARDAIRLQRGPARGALRPETVRLRGGVYRLERTFELDARDSRVAFKPALGEEARIIGGIELPAGAAQPVTDAAILERVISEEARSQLRQIDLKAIGITDSGPLGPRGFGRPYRPAPLELFIDSKPMQVARWPNAGKPKIPMGPVVEKGSGPRAGDYTMKPGVFQYTVDRPKLWSHASDLYISGIFAQNWADDTIPVAKVDTEKGTFTTALPHLYGFSRKPFCTWYALNLLEEIDVPGEYFVDGAAGVLYFYPPQDFSPGSQIALSTLKDPLVAIEGAEGVVFENLTFEISRGTGFYIEGSASNTIAGCTLRNLGIMAVQMGMGATSVPDGRHDGHGNLAPGEKPPEPASRIAGSWHQYIYKHSAWDRKAGTGHRIVSCDIYDTGAGGVLLGGGDRVTLTPGSNSVENCDIYRVNRWDRTYRAAINLDGDGNAVRHCRLHDCQGQAILLHGNDHTIEFNDIFRVCRDISDSGAIYMGRDISETGHQIRYNYFHDIRSFHPGCNVHAILFDDWIAEPADVVGNVFRSASSSGVIKFFFGGSRGIRNNVFVDCPPPVIGTGDNTKVIQGTFRIPRNRERLFQNVNITTPPYSTRYPLLLAIYEGRQKVITTFEKNIVTRAADPSFVDGPHGNFAFRPGAPVLKKTPGFQLIPFEKIGLRADEYRSEDKTLNNLR